MEQMTPRATIAPTRSSGMRCPAAGVAGMTISGCWIRSTPAPASTASRSPSLLVAWVSATNPRLCVSSTSTACCAGENPISDGTEKCAVPPYLTKSTPLSR